MRSRTCIALLLLLSACATMDPSPGEWEDPSPRFANLQRAAQYPWTDDGHCVVREAASEWPALAERCFHALDHDRVKFRDVTGRCAVASAGAAAATMGVGLCVFASPAVVAGAVIVIGVVVVAVAIKEGIGAYERNASRERAKPRTPSRPSNEENPVANQKPEPKEGQLGRDWLPPIPSDPSERPECTPIPGPPRGGRVDPGADWPRAPHRSGRAQLTHPALRATVSLFTLLAIRLSFVQMLWSPMSPASFPPAVPCHGVPFPPQGPEWAGSPASSVV
jgi:hypothetical protein